MGWTDDQKKAIAYNKKATIVSASAGSGKTAVLVERVKRIIMDTSDPVPADKMVISTFTNDAADELKARLSKAIDEELEKDPSNDHLERQRIRLEDAYISTISSFCMQLLRRNSAQAGLEPGFKVIDEPEAKLIFSQSLTAVLEDFCENGDPDERDTLYEWFAGETDARIEEALNSLYTLSRNIPDPDKYFSEQLLHYSDPDAADPAHQALQNGYLRNMLANTLPVFERYIERLTPLTSNTPAASLPAEWRALLDPLYSVRDLAAFEAVHTALAAAAVPAVPRKTRTFDNTKIKGINDDFRDDWKDFISRNAVVFTRSDDMIRCAPILGTLISLTKKLDKEYTARKRDRNGVDFSDIEILTLRMLRDDNGDPSDIAKAIASEIKVIIVDEFQDSNDIQYEIFRLISDDRKNLYLVGDVKQSIYGFRGADPLVFARLEKDTAFDVIRLNKNFRSCAEVINSVNAIFTGTMTEQLGDVDYGANCALVQGKSYSTGTANRTELLTFSGKKIEESKAAEAAYIAARIRKMIDDGFEITEDGNKRPCRYGDIVVLNRYNKNIEPYLDAFRNAGIPFEAKSNDDYTDFTEVKHALALLRVIDDPYRDTDLAAVLMKEPYLLSAEETADIKLAGGTKNPSLWDGLNKAAKTDIRAKKILDEINRYRSFAEENSAERLIRHICDESLLIPAAQAAPDGVKKARNLHKLILFAEKFTGGESASLYDFIKYIDNISSRGIRLTKEKASAGADAVRFMTIHGSKGLEFPICFVSNVTSTERKISDEFICDPRFGIGMKISDTANMVMSSTFTYENVKEEKLRRQRSEEMRLLYVAATRAKEKLIFTVPLTPKGEPDMHYGWILNSSAVCLDPARRQIDVTNDPVLDLPDSGANDTDDTEDYVLPEFTEYKFRRFSDIPAKVTATQVGVKSAEDLSDERNKLDRFLRLPSFIGRKDDPQARLSGKKRGDAYHKVMEALDFGASAGDVPAILDELLARGVLSGIERESVDVEDIVKFLESDICRRAHASGEIYREYPIFCEYSGDEFGTDGWENEPRPFVQGIADMFFVESGEIVLVDYKTNRNTTKEKLTDEYTGQLAIYAEALEKATGLKVKQKLLYSFELGEINID